MLQTGQGYCDTGGIFSIEALNVVQAHGNPADCDRQSFVHSLRIDIKAPPPVPTAASRQTVVHAPSRAESRGRF